MHNKFYYFKVTFWLLCLLTDPPVITSNFPTILTVRPGEHVHIKCDAVGNPAPVVYWKLQQNDLVDGLLSSALQSC